MICDGCHGKHSSECTKSYAQKSACEENGGHYKEILRLRWEHKNRKEKEK